MALPFEQINGQTLTSKQRSYLDGLFTGLRNRGFSFTDVEANPASASKATPPAGSALNFAERGKRELHPFPKRS